MRILEKVIFDTNTLRNIEPKSFLGGRDELQKFAKVADIIFPDIVIEELKYQKRKTLEAHKQSFLKNPFHWIRGIPPEEIKNFDNDAHITDLETKEDIKYTIIQLSDYSVLAQMKDLALKKLPPFEEGDGTDKGFKDAYIYFTILEYLQTIPDKYIFVCTKDGRFKVALQQHSNIKVIESYAEYLRQSSISFYTDYFIEQLKIEIDPSVTRDSITDFWVNIQDNYVLLITTESGTFVVEMDSGEIVKSTNRDGYLSFIDTFVFSGSFATTHAAIEHLGVFVDYFSDEEVVKILNSYTENSQVWGIMSDDDVKEFFFSLYDKKKDTLTPELRQKLENRINFLKDNGCV